MLKKIFYEIINFFKAILVLILGFFLRSKNKTENQESSTEENPTGSSKVKNINPFDSEQLPDEIATKENPHDSDTTNDIILELPKNKFEKVKKKNLNEETTIFTINYFNKIIEKKLEEIYKDRELKIEKLDERFEEEKEILKTIRKFEERIIPKIERKIEFYHLKKEEDVKDAIEKIVEVEVKEFPILPPLTIEVSEQKEQTKKEVSKTKTDYTKEKINEKQEERTINQNPQSSSPQKDEIYFVAVKKDKQELNFKEPPEISSKPIATTNDIEPIKKHAEEQSIIMVKNVEEIPKPKLADVLKNTAAVTTEIAIKTAEEIIAQSPTKDNTNEDLKTIEKRIDNEEIKDLTEAKKLKSELEHKLKDIQEEKQNKAIFEQKLKEEQEKKKNQEQANNPQDQKEIERQKKEQEKRYSEAIAKEEEEIKRREEQTKSLVRDTDIAAITIETDDTISQSQEEIKKEDFFDKDYDRMEKQINHMLDDIESTRLRYGNSLSPKQKNKLNKEEEKLRDAKHHLEFQKKQDIDKEQKELYNYITQSEIKGLQDELERINKESRLEINEGFMNRIDALENKTEQEITNMDKKILHNKLNKALFLLEMGSILTFPFIRNRYFFNFTIGLIINNHFNILNSFWKRQDKEAKPANLENIRQGQDALNGALDITYQNIIELEQIEQDALSRYPELANDPAFIAKITNLRLKLNNNYNKLMKKNEIMEKQYGKTKHQVKILKKEL